MASTLFEELKTVATEVKKSQPEDAVVDSWVAATAKDHSQVRGIGTLLIEAGA